MAVGMAGATIWLTLTQPVTVADAVADYLQNSGLNERVEQGSVVTRWGSLVGPKIAAATEPVRVSADGVLFVAVKSNAWMAELSLLEPELLRAINVQPGRRPIRKIRFQLMR
jgi:predicted nucleic acid-binding Zn ribbon protein